MKLPINEVFETAYYWLAGTKNSQIATIIAFSNLTVTSIARKFRKSESDSLDFNNITIGGYGIIVEIDEAKLGKVKYHRGH